MFSFSWYSVILLMGVIQGLIISLMLIANKKSRNMFLGLIILDVALDLFISFLENGQWFDKYPNLYFLPLYYSLGYGPLVYLCTKRFLDIKISKAQYLNFIPVILQGFFYVSVCWMNVADKGNIYRSLYSPFVRPLEHYGTIFTMVIYLSLSIKLIIANRKALHPSSGGKRLAKITLSAMSLIFILWLTLPPLVQYYHLHWQFDIFYIVMALFVYGIGFTAFRYSLNDESIESIKPKSDQGAEPAKLSIISSDQLTAYCAQLDSLLIHERLFTDPELSLQMIAKKLKTNIKVVSYVINTGMNSTFHNLINSYRVKEAKKLIENGKNDHLTLLAIAYNAGFNSKSSFNLIFKQHTGMTPKAYKMKKTDELSMEMI